MDLLYTNNSSYPIGHALNAIHFLHFEHLQEQSEPIVHCILLQGFLNHTQIEYYFLCVYQFLPGAILTNLSF
nr:MAG TPA: hypothetical protein [Bacteriophage sp.]